MFGMTDGTKECILTAETHAKGTQFAEEGNVQTVVSNFLVDIPKGLLDYEVVLWPKIPGTNTNNMSQIINWYRLKCIAMDAEVNAL